MVRRSKKTEKSQTKLQDFVIVTITEDLEQAQDRDIFNRPQPLVQRERHS